MDPDWRCKTQIENGDIPASYVHLPERLTYNTSFNSCNKKTAVVKKKEPTKNGQTHPPAAQATTKKTKKTMRGTTKKSIFRLHQPSSMGGREWQKSILFVFGLLNTWHFFWAPKKLNVLFLEFRKEWDIVYLCIYTRYMYIHIYFQDFFF